MTNLVWFRNDLRSKDNSALFYACKDQNVKVIALFIVTNEQWHKNKISLRKINFIYKNLLSLQNTLSKIGIPLFYKKVKTFDSSLIWLKNFSIKKKLKKFFIINNTKLMKLKEMKN